MYVVATRRSLLRWTPTAVLLFRPEQPAADDSAETGPPGGLKRPRTDMHHMAHVLVVDDSAELREVVRSLLKQTLTTALIDEAASAEEALDAVHDAIRSGKTFDLIVSDHRMGRMTGLELLRQIRAEGAATRTVLMSGDADAETAARDDPAVDFFLSKPFGVLEFRRALATP